MVLHAVSADKCMVWTLLRCYLAIVLTLVRGFYFFKSTPSSTIVTISRSLFRTCWTLPKSSFPSAKPMEISGATLTVQPGCTRWHWAPVTHTIQSRDAQYHICVFVLHSTIGLEHCLPGWFMAQLFGGLLYTASLTHTRRWPQFARFYFLHRFFKTSQFCYIFLSCIAGQWFDKLSTCLVIHCSEGGATSVISNKNPVISA